MVSHFAHGIRTEDILCPGGMPAFVARPIAESALPVMIVLHERYGLVSHTRELATRCAADGYLAIAPDLYFKHPDKSALNSGDSRYQPRDLEINQFLKGVLAMLADDPEANLKQVVVAGFCQTGRYPIILAAEERIAAAVIWYGGAASQEWEVTPQQPVAFDDLIARIHCPVFGAFGARDHIISVDHVAHLRNALERHRKSYEIGIYANAPHGWLNDTMPGRYRRDAAEAAWSAQQTFLERVLAPDFDPDIVSWRFSSDIHSDYDFANNVRLE